MVQGRQEVTFTSIATTTICSRYIFRLKQRWKRKVDADVREKRTLTSGNISSKDRLDYGVISAKRKRVDVLEGGGGDGDKECSGYK